MAQAETRLTKEKAPVHILAGFGPSYSMYEHAVSSMFVGGKTNLILCMLKHSIPRSAPFIAWSIHMYENVRVVELPLLLRLLTALTSSERIFPSM